MYDDPPHITIPEYEQVEPRQPSLQITFPFDCGPAAQLTPPWLEQHPLLAKIILGEIRNNKTKIEVTVVNIFLLI